MTSPVPTPKTLLSDKTYSTLKLFAVLVLPLLGAFYFALSGIWHLPGGEQVTGTIAAINVFVGGLVTYAKQLHQASGAGIDGTFDIVHGEDTDSLRLTSLAPQAVLSKDILTFKINHPS